MTEQSTYAVTTIYYRDILYMLINLSTSLGLHSYKHLGKNLSNLAAYSLLK